MHAVRSYAFAVFITLATVTMALAFLPTLILGRRAAMAATRVWAKTFLFGLRTFCGLTYRIHGAEHIPRGGAVVASKHQTQWETVALTALLPQPIFVLKRELLRVPIIGWWTARVGMIGVDRSGGAKALRRMAGKAKARLAQGAQIIIFPEGTRTPPGERGDYKPGVAALYTQLQTPCVPVAHNSGLFWLHPGLIRRPGVIDLVFLPPIPPGLKRREFQATLRAQIEAETDRLLTAQPGAARGEA